jgi:hypothetical protein
MASSHKTMGGTTFCSERRFGVCAFAHSDRLGADGHRRNIHCRAVEFEFHECVDLLPVGRRDEYPGPFLSRALDAVATGLKA